jgi:hypothetical protein
VAQLRVVLEGVESRQTERAWLKHQTSGELDDAKLVDGVTGERNIYKKRGEENAPVGTVQQHPKRILFVMDVSGSMYRFNGQDGRLERSLEAAMLVMESFHGFEQRYDYAIRGHSGDGPDIAFVEFGEPPANRRERLNVLQKMLAHSQFCMSGDHTLEATAQAVKSVMEVEADDHFVIVVSDANLRRYGIQPRELGKILTSDRRVQVWVWMMRLGCVA